MRMSWQLLQLVCSYKWICVQLIWKADGREVDVASLSVPTLIMFSFSSADGAVEKQQATQQVLWPALIIAIADVTFYGIGSSSI